MRARGCLMDLAVALAVVCGVLFLLNRIHLLGINPLSTPVETGIAAAAAAIALSMLKSKRRTRRH